MFVLFTTLNFSQNKLEKIISLGFEVRNCTIGSNPTNNKAELDVIVNFTFIKKKIETGFGYESFKAIGFNKYTFSIGRQIKITEDLKLIPALEFTDIQRSKEIKGYYLSLAGNLALRHKINNSFEVELLINALPRTDLLIEYDDFRIVYSNYLKLVYKL